ncbi:hypothetical protein FVQ98_04345 [Ottowia sp. GY511]|uniref:Uncharacterized protein n=1 Tax=Ottowia flava TaxID=2675430 RepID=A0ABW4KYA2_9BURK|nr:hypothetical protein [Ottowia sp. GY511]TXK31216.1 hypothetical protein FVQ98_04345 [Ottowia sp. GY511]
MLSAGKVLVAALATLPGEPMDLGRVPGYVDVIAWLLRHVAGIALFQVALAAATVWAGFGLLRRRAWARATLEGVGWLVLLQLAAVAALGWQVFADFSELPQDSPGLGSQPEWLDIVAMLVGLLAVALPVVAAVRYLRSASVRALVRGR